MLQKVIGIVREASQLMNNEVFEVIEKGASSNIVTSSDLNVQKFLCEHLGQLLPNSGFLCEEEGVWDTTKEYSWVIDPIDGTTNYARGITECAISVALKHFDEIEIGVVYLPRSDKMFYAQKGSGSFCNEKQLHVSKRPFQDSIMCTALAVYHKDCAEICSKIIVDTFLKCNDIRRFGAAAPELSYLALGLCELYFEYKLSPWDFAAASLIVTEAGGIVTNLKGEPFTFLEPSGVIAANTQGNHRQLLEIVQKYTKNGC